MFSIIEPNMGKRMFHVKKLLGIILVFMILLLISVSSKNIDAHWTESDEFILDKDLIYSAAKNGNYKNSTSEYTEHVITNSLGYRDNEFKKKNPTVFRIITVGDSFTFGHGIANNDETYPKKLERYLKSNGKNIEVLNVAVKGYSPDKEYRQILHTVFALNPDMIIWNLSNPGDIFNLVAHEGDWPSPSLYDIKDSRLIPLDARFNWVYVGKYIKQFAPAFIQNNSFLSRFIQFGIFRASQSHIGTRKPFLSDEQLINWALQKLNLQIEDIRKKTDDKKIKLVIAILPYPSNFNEKDKNTPFNSFFTQLQKKGLLIINVEKKIGEKNIQSNNLFYKIDYHPNTRGTSVFSEIVGDFISPLIP